jgi:hypothetical protein
VSRPEIFDKIHEAHYELEFAQRDEKAEKLRAYEALLAAQAAKLNCSPSELRAALHRDYKVWRKQNKLPPIVPRQEDKSNG